MHPPHSGLLKRSSGVCVSAAAPRRVTHDSGLHSQTDSHTYCRYISRQSPSHRMKRVNFLIFKVKISFCCSYEWPPRVPAPAVEQQ